MWNADTLPEANAALADQGPEATIAWGLEHGGDRAVVSTNFRPYEAVILHLVTQQRPDIPVLWIDHGYNTSGTYACAEKLIKQLNLNVHLYIPKRTAAHRDTLNGGIPSIDDEAAHDAFTEEVKLEPFRRGMRELDPTVWFTALRADQTAHRQSLDILTPHGEDVLKVSPILQWTDEDLEAYIKKHDLPNEHKYYDPTKVLEKRECGLHTSASVK